MVVPRNSVMLKMLLPILIAAFVATTLIESSTASAVDPSAQQKKEAKKKYRGKINIQGGNVKDDDPTKVRSWAQDTPVTKTEGLKWLQELEDGLTKDQKKEWKEPIEKARRHIENAPKTGISAHGKKSFEPHPKPRSGIRVDIDIEAGEAFVEDATVKP